MSLNSNDGSGELTTTSVSSDGGSTGSNSSTLSSSKVPASKANIANSVAPTTTLDPDQSYHDLEIWLHKL